VLVQTFASHHRQSPPIAWRLLRKALIHIRFGREFRKRQVEKLPTMIGPYERKMRPINAWSCRRTFDRRHEPIPIAGRDKILCMTKRMGGWDGGGVGVVDMLRKRERRVGENAPYHQRFEGLFHPIVRHNSTKSKGRDRGKNIDTIDFNISVVLLLLSETLAHIRYGR
jgi:hypothetical protein